MSVSPTCMQAVMGSCSLAGNSRDHDEDRVGVAYGRFAVIADGVGSLPAGSLFAEAVMWESLRTVSALGATPEEALRASHAAAQRLAIAMGIAEPSGASAACLVVDGSHVELARAGDVAVFAVGAHGATRLLDTVDHRDVRGRLLTYVGMVARRLEVDLLSLDLGEEARAVVVTTDGIADHLRPALVGDIVLDALAQGDSLACSHAARNLALAAMAHGSPDDVTALVVSLA